MRVRLSMVLLLIMTTMTMAASHPLSFKGNPPAIQQERELTSEEEAEARAVVRRFGERWLAKNDFGQIVDELFVKDFSERLWQAPPGELPWALLDKTLFPDASLKELRRFYVAALNFYGLYSRLYEETERVREKSENNESDLKVEEVLSPEVVKVLLTNQTLTKWVELDKETESDELTKEDDNRQPAESGDSTPPQRATAEANAGESTEQDKDGIIKTLPELNDVSATLEKANELMRRRLANIKGKAQASSGNDDAKSEQDTSKLSLTSLDEEEYGYPKDTPVIHLDALPFCLHLIRIDGQLMILSVSIYID